MCDWQQRENNPTKFDPFSCITVTLYWRAPYLTHVWFMAVTGVSEWLNSLIGSVTTVGNSPPFISFELNCLIAAVHWGFTLTVDTSKPHIYLMYTFIGVHYYVQNFG